MPKKQPKCKLCRAKGKKLMLKGERCFSPKCALVKRNYPPGLHGLKNTRKKFTEYGLQLNEKQKAKQIYGVYERVFKRYYEKAMNMKGSAGDNLVQLLERRLDNVIYRAGIAKSRNQAKQLVGHGHFLVNGRKVDIPSYQVKVNDVIKLRDNKKEKKVFQALQQELKGKKKADLPSWLFFDKDKMEIKILSLPKAEETERLFDTKMIIEFYSR